jgi:hypothetical protein
MAGMGLPAVQNRNTVGLINENVVEQIVVSCIRSRFYDGVHCGELHKVWVI